jgi:hypothetical protein
MYTILQIIISVVVIYLIFSVLVYVIVEWISGMLQMRGKMLRKAVLDLFRDERIGKLIYDHPHVESLKPANGRLPSYIPASSVAAVLIDIVGAKVTEDPAARISQPYQNFVKGIETLEKSHHRELLITLAQQAKDVKALTASIEKWYNDAMDRVSGWYKKRLRTVIVIVAAVVTVGFNVDTIHVILATKADPALRQQLNDLADRVINDATINQIVAEDGGDLNYREDYVNDSSINPEDSIALQADAAHQDSIMEAKLQKKTHERMDQFVYLNQLISDSSLPIGWGKDSKFPSLYVLLGWMITTVALTAGAPFWFDMLKKLVNIRAAGIKPLAAGTTQNETEKA